MLTRFKTCNAFFVILVLNSFLAVAADTVPPGNTSYGTWHNEFRRNTDRLLLFKEDEEAVIQNRILNGDAIFAKIFSNTYLGRYASEIYGIYQNALTDNAQLQTRDARARAAKNKAFVYRIGLGADQNNNLYFLSDSEKETFKNQALELLNTLDVSCWSGSQSRPSNGFEEFLFLINHDGEQYDLQYRSRELIYCLEAYDLLRPIQDARVWNDAISRKIIKFASNIYFMADIFADYYTRNNHRILTGSALGMAAVLFGDWGSNSSGMSSREARSYMPYIWIGYAMNNIENVMFGYQVYPDGGYNEGPQYLRYSMTFALPFFKAMKNFGEVFLLADAGKPAGDWTEIYNNGHGANYSLRSPWFGRIYDQHPDYGDVFTWITKIRQPEGRIPGIADTFNESYFPELSIIGGNYFWPLKSFDAAVSDDAMLNMMLVYLSDVRADFISAGNLPQETSPDWGKMVVFPQTGEIVLRNGWGSEDIYMHVYARNYAYGQTNYDLNSHIQHDNSSFVLGYKGQVLALDGGYISFSQKPLVENPQNHNLILVNGQGPMNYQATAQIEDTTENDFVKFARINTNYQNSNIKRDFIFVADKYFIIHDEINSNTSNEYKFLLHGNDNNPQLLNNGAIWKIGNAKLKSVVCSDLGSGNLSYAFTDFIHDDGYNRTLPHKTLEAGKNSQNAQFLSIHYPFDMNATDEPEIIDVSTSAYAGLFVDRTVDISFGNRYEMLIAQMNPGNQINISENQYGIYNRLIKSLETDARLLVVSFDPINPQETSQLKIFSRDLTYFKYDNELLIPNSAPEILPVADPVVNEGSELIIPVTVTDVNSRTIRMEAINLPLFADFTDSGNGSASLRIAPGYFDAGNYPNITVIARDGGIPVMADSIVFSLTVNNFNLAPVAAASANTESGAPPLSVQFSSADSHDPDGSITNTTWDFGDGTNSMQPNPQHIYVIAGKFLSVLTITDNNGVSSKDTVTIFNNADLQKLFISEISDAADASCQFLEIYNNAQYAVNLNGTKIIQYDDSGGQQNVYDIGFNEEISGTSTIVPSAGILIIARGATLSEFENVWARFAVTANFNSGNSSLQFGDLKPQKWRFRYFDGSFNQDDGSLIDDTEIAVGGRGNRSYKSENGEWITTGFASASPGFLDIDQSLSVELNSFTAVGQDKSVLLNWETKSELNNQGFVIQRSNSSTGVFEEIASYHSDNALAGLGNSSAGKSYEFVDRKVTNGILYWYKLIDVNFMGRKREYEPVSAVPHSE